MPAAQTTLSAGTAPAQDLHANTDTFFYLIPTILLALVLAVQSWGWAALVIAALGLVPVMFVFFIAISWP